LFVFLFKKNCVSCSLSYVRVARPLVTLRADDATMHMFRDTYVSFDFLPRCAGVGNSVHTLVNKEGRKQETSELSIVIFIVDHMTCSEGPLGEMHKHTMSKVKMTGKLFVFLWTQLFLDVEFLIHLI